MSKYGYSPDCHVFFATCCRLFAQKKLRKGGYGQIRTPPPSCYVPASNETSPLLRSKIKCSFLFLSRQLGLSVCLQTATVIQEECQTVLRLYTDTVWHETLAGVKNADWRFFSCWVLNFAIIRKLCLLVRFFFLTTCNRQVSEKHVEI